MSADLDAYTNLIRSVGPSPCDRCQHRRRCGLEQLACRRFAAWTHDGRPHLELPAEPTAAQWRRLYADDPT